MITVVLICVFLLIVLYSWIQMLLLRTRSKISGPFPIPILGASHLFITKPTKMLDVMKNIKQKYGDICTGYLFNEKFVVVSNPKYAEFIMSSNKILKKGSSYKVMEPWLGESILLTTGQRWKEIRKLAKPAFSKKVLSNYFPTFLKNKRTLLKMLQSKANGVGFDLMPFTSLITLDNATEAITGVNFDTLKAESTDYVEAIETITYITMLKMTNIIYMFDAIFKLLPENMKLKKALHTYHQQSWKVIEARKKDLENIEVRSEGFQNYMDLLLRANFNYKDYVREEVDTIMVAGHDTTSLGLAFALYCIAEHEDVQRKILEEQQAILGYDLTRDPTYDEVQEMKYLECVIKEALRLYPPGPLLQRMVTEDVDMMGMRLLKGSTVMVDVFHMHRSPEVYEDPLEFRPERFIDHDKAKPGYDWLPFSAGLRGCLGQNFAMMELKATIAGIVNNYKLASSGVPPELYIAIVLKSKNGVNIRMTPRNNRLLGKGDHCFV